MEDDIISATGAVGKMMEFAESNNGWLLIDFCQLGSMGILTLLTIKIKILNPR